MIMNHLCIPTFEQQIRLVPCIQLIELDHKIMYQAISQEMIQPCRSGRLERMLVPRPIFSTSMTPALRGCKHTKPTKRKLAAPTRNAGQAKPAPVSPKPAVSHNTPDVSSSSQAKQNRRAKGEAFKGVDSTPDHNIQDFEPVGKLDRSKGLMLKCRYCGSVNTEAQLNEHKQIYDPHLKRHLPGSFDRKDPAGMTSRSGRCIFCYAEFPKASALVASDAGNSSQVYHGTLGLEANKVTLRLRKKCVDDPDSSLRYRVLLHNTGMINSVLGKVCDKASKSVNSLN